MKKYLLCLFFFTLLGNTLFAAFVTDFPIEIQQPNGETVQLYVTGDEFHRRVHDAAGFTIIKDPQTGYLVYAVLKNDELISSGYFVGKTDPQKVGLTPDVDISAERRRQIRQRFLDAAPVRSDLRTSSASLDASENTGQINNLVIYIRFADDPEFTQSGSYFADFFNKDEPGASMYRYFHDISHGQLSVHSTFYPTPTGTTVLSYRDTQPRSTFASVSTPEQIAAVEHALLRRAIYAVRDQIPSDLNLDFNNDGCVDNICFIVKGNPGAWSSLLWPHQWVLFSYDIAINGKRVQKYNFQIENHLISNSGRQSVLTHEMYHTLGAPDYYRYDDKTIDPVGVWDVMASTANPPQSSTAWVSRKYAPWVTPEITEITEPGTYTINNVWLETNNCYQIASPNSSTEFFLIEYRDKNVIWDASLPGSGLIIYRVNPGLEGNASGPPDEVYVFREGARNMTTKGNLNQAYFSSQSGRTLFSDTSNPPAFLSNNTSGLGDMAIYDIGPSGGETMSFKVDFLPKTDFSFEAQFGLTVQFVNTSIASSETEWLWDFGDGTPASTEKNPVHTYDAAGYYNVTLVAKNRVGKRDKTIRTAVDVSCGGNGSSSDPYLICKAKDLDAIRDNISAHFKLANDIDLSDYLAEGGDGYTKWGSAGWMPIGNTTIPFTGSIDGNGYKVTGLWINRNTYHTGLFGYLLNAKIEKLGVEIDVVGIKATDYVGGLAGLSENSHISNSYAAGNISGGNNIGGLVGCLESSPNSGINNSYAMGNIRGINSVGGLVGNQKSSVNDSYAASNVSGNNIIGGLIGYQSPGAGISNCYATGDVNGNSAIGGLVGYRSSNSTGVFDSYVIGNISGNSNVGGIVGTQENNSNIRNNYHHNLLNLNSAVIADTDSDNAHNRKHGAAKSFAELQSFAFFNAPSNWSTVWRVSAENNRIWTIWEGKSYLYFSFQSAPVYNPIATSSGISFELRNAVESIQIYNYRTGSIEILGAQTAGIKNITAQSLSANFLQEGDTLQFVVYEENKMASYLVNKEIQAISPFWGGMKVYEANGLIQIFSGEFVPIKEVAIYSLEGRLLHKEPLSDVISHTINWNWPTGVYVVRVVSEKNTNNIKLITK
ncbi:MAG: M6 family metalloprotease domain-containing protein [Dysgonamonadaceae bacterium]|jgi:M6 family metalloprotease-like protein|nr:M6 family metalloprotease domain-containing protein [Dysgonamonadaceae bacterium]